MIGRVSLAVKVAVRSALCFALVWTARAQVSVTTFHNDNSRTGQNTMETILNPTNVRTQFGKIFSVPVDGYVYAQPLYLANVVIGGGTHNVVYAATQHDSLYAIDANTGTIYWKLSLIPAGATTVSSTNFCGDIVPEMGITGTPVIDTSTNTIYLVTKTTESTGFVQRLHAIDAVTHVEKFGGPVVISATVPGTGDGTSGGKVSFDPLRANQRPGLLLENGHVIIGWAGHCEITPYHGWVMSYSASTLTQEAVLNLSPNGTAAGTWMSGDGIAADGSGNLFFATGNGTYDGTTSGDYGSTIMKLSSPAGGKFTVEDWFTPWNQASLTSTDFDVASGGVVLLPDLPAGSAHQQMLTLIGKEGTLFLVDRNNMGKYCAACSSVDTNIVQEIPAASAGIWGSPAYWNGTIYWGAGTESVGDNLKAFSFDAGNSGKISTSPTSESTMIFNYSTAAPAISANGASNGILWILDNSAWASSGNQILYAFDATNISTLLYSSSLAPNSRDVPGAAVKFTAPTVANGNVYVGSASSVSAYGLLVATPTFSPAPGNYGSAVSVTISDTTAGATIHCTTNGTTPTASSPTCSTVNISATTTLQAIAVASGFGPSAVGGGTYSITTGAVGISLGAGFTSSGMTFNGSTQLNGTRLRLTDGGASEAASAFFNTPQNVQSFTTNFSFQLSNPNADGMTFTIQNTGLTALSGNGGGLGYGSFSPSNGVVGIGKSVAVKFDLFNNAGEGTNSVGLYTNGASPTIPAVTLGGGVNLHSGDVFNTQITYNGTTLTLTITDASVPADTFTTSWTINIPSVVGANTAYVGFTAGTGGLTAIQDILSWTYSTAASVNFSAGFTASGMTFNGSTQLNGTRLRLTDGGASEASSAFFNTLQNVQLFTTSFSFQLTNPNADGMTFTIQNTGLTALSGNGGGLGYGSFSPSNGVVGIGNSVAVKFDLYNNAGEGTNSVGLYTNGASPTIPAVTLGGGVNLHSGDVFNTQITYNGTTLTLTITDASVPADTFTTSWTINIPSTVGANTAYVGFTAGTGGLTATQDILTWTFAP